VKKFSLDENEQEILAEYCKSVNIDFASTPYSIEEANFLINKCKVPFIKVASMDINNYPYLRYLAKTESAIIISSGMANFDEITKAIKLLESEGAKNVILLHCISIYPAAPELINLNHIRFLKESFPNITIGYSDHTLGIEVGIASVAMGACVVEKHFSLDSSVIGMDNQMAMEEKELTQMVTSIKNTFRALGTQEKIVSEEELDQSKKMRRSLVAAKEMKIGDILTEDCLEAKRPGTGICVSEWDTYLNKKITKPILKDSLLTKGHFE
jgi:N-acetylneuraminate synthase